MAERRFALASTAAETPSARLHRSRHDDSVCSQMASAAQARGAKFNHGMLQARVHYDAEGSIDTPEVRAVPSERRRRLLLIASSGGHIYEMLCLRDFWQDKDRYWVTFGTTDSRYLLRDEEDVQWAAHPTVRNIPNLMRNLGLAFLLLIRERPAMILTTGSGVAAPFLWLAWFLRIPTVFVESITRITEISLTARMVRPFASHFLVQWPELVDQIRRAEYHGRIV